MGLPILECKEASGKIQAGDDVEVDFSTGEITDHTLGMTFKAEPFPPFVQEIIKVGGWVNYLIKNGSR